MFSRVNPGRTATTSKWLAGDASTDILQPGGAGPAERTERYRKRQNVVSEQAQVKLDNSDLERTRNRRRCSRRHDREGLVAIVDNRTIATGRAGRPDGGSIRVLYPRSGIA